jgi:hyperosmotically inducible protein
MSKKLWIVAIAALALALGVACNNKKVANIDKDAVANAEKQAGYNDVDVSVDNDKNVVTLSGKVQSQDQKDKAGDVAKGVAGTAVVANEISVEPQGVESQARSIESNLDDAIEHNFKAVLVSHRMDKDHIRYDSKNGVLTLKGSVPNMQERKAAEKLAASVPHVTQVVNELEVKGNGSDERAASE